MVFFEILSEGRKVVNDALVFGSKQSERPYECRNSSFGMREGMSRGELTKDSSESESEP